MIRLFYLITSISGGLNALSLILMGAAYPFGLSFFALILSLILFFSLVILSDAPNAQIKSNNTLPVSLLRNLQSSSQQKFHAKIQNLFQKPFFIWCLMGLVSVPALSLLGNHHTSITFNHFFMIGALCFLTKMAVFQWKSTKLLTIFLGTLFLLMSILTLNAYGQVLNNEIHFSHLIFVGLFTIIPLIHILSGLNRQAPHRSYAMLGLLSLIAMATFSLIAPTPLWIWLVFWPLIWLCAFRSRPRAAKTYRQFQQ